MVGKPKTSIFYGWVIVAAASVVLALQWGCNDSYAIFLTELCQEFGWTKTMVSGAFSLFSFVSCTLGLIAGRLNDKYGPRLTLSISLIVIATGYALMSTISAPWQLYVYFGAIVAGGASFSWVPAVSTVSRWFIKKRGTALGITTAGMGIGVAMMVPLVQFLVIKFGWRICYLILSGLLLTGLPASRLMRLKPSEKGLYPDGINVVTHNPDSYLPNIKSFTFKQAISTKQFWLLFSLCAISAIPSGILIHLKAYMISFNISEMTAATVIGLSSLTYTVGAIIISGLSDKTGRKVTLFLSFLLMTLITLWLIRASQTWEFYLFSIVFGFSWGGFVLFPAITADWFGMKFQGSIYGMLEIGWGIGGAIAPISIGYIYDITGGYKLAFILSAVTLSLATGLSLMLKIPYKKAKLSQE